MPAGVWLDYGVEVGNAGSVSILRSTISGNTGIAADSSASAGVLITGTSSDAQISDSVITANTKALGVGFGTTDTATATASDNDFSGNVDFAVRHTNTGSTVYLDTSGNWWGSNDPTTVAAAIGEGEVDYTPWLEAGTDTDLGTAGFQGDFSHVHVDDDSPQFGSTARVQEGIDMAIGSTVEIHAGTYEGPIDIDSRTDLNLVGDDRATTKIESSATTGWNVGGYGTSRTAVLRIVDSTSVDISGLTFDYGLVKANLVFGMLMWDSSGSFTD